MVLDGRTLYLGGQFGAIAGQSRANLASIDVATGTVTPWNAHVVGQRVSALAIRGDDLFVGGVFSRVGGQSHRSLAVVDARTGVADSTNLDADDWVRSVALTASDIYVGGNFAHIAGAARSCLAKIDARTRQVSEWNPRLGAPDNPYDEGPYVGGIVPAGRTLFIAGHFSSVGGLDRGGVAELDAATGAATAWDPQPAPRYTWIAPYVTALAVGEGEVLIGGGFETLGGQQRSHVGAVSAATGRATGWNPHANYYVDALAVQGPLAYVGGRFSSVGSWVKRRGLAALDASTGMVTPWDPDPDGLIVYALAATDSTIYVGGDFSNIGGATRSGIAALDPIGGTATAWNPRADGAVATIAVDGQTVYAGGGFSAIGGQTRRYLAALDARTGLATAWDPSATAEVFSLAVDTSRVYAGGFFLGIGGQERHSIAALDKTTGAATPWNPDADNWVNSLAISGPRIYVGGAFSSIGGTERQGLAAIDAATGSVLGWDAGLTPGDRSFCDVFCVATLGSLVLAGGDFGGAAGEPRYGLAVLDSASAKAAAWNPDLDEFVWSLLPYGNTMYVGGRFGRMGGTPRASVAAVEFGAEMGRPADVGPTSPPIVAVQSVSPNPMCGDADLRYSLSVSAPVSVAMYDVQGRRVATVLNHEWQQAGSFTIPLRAGGLPAGAYLCRIEASGSFVTRRVLIVK